MWKLSYARVQCLYLKKEKLLWRYRFWVIRNVDGVNICFRVVLHFLFRQDQNAYQCIRLIIWHIETFKTKMSIIIYAHSKWRSNPQPWILNAFANCFSNINDHQNTYVLVLVIIKSSEVTVMPYRVHIYIYKKTESLSFFSFVVYFTLLLRRKIRIRCL